MIHWPDDTTDVIWNFGKFLVDKDGTAVQRYGSKVAPENMEMEIRRLTDAVMGDKYGDDLPSIGAATEIAGENAKCDSTPAATLEATA